MLPGDLTVLREEPVATMAKCPLLQLLTFWVKEPSAVRALAAEVEAARLEAGHYTARELLLVLTRVLETHTPVRAEFDNLLRQGTARFHGKLVVGCSLGLLTRLPQGHASPSAGEGKRQKAKPKASCRGQKAQPEAACRSSRARPASAASSSAGEGRAQKAKPKAARRGQKAQPAAAQPKGRRRRLAQKTALRPAGSRGCASVLRELPTSSRVRPASADEEFAALFVGHGGQTFRAQADESLLQEALAVARRFASQLSKRPADSPSTLWKDLQVYERFLKSLPKQLRLGGGYQTKHFLRKRLHWLLTEEVRQSKEWKTTSFRRVAEISADQQGVLSSLPGTATIETVEQMLGVDAQFASMWACLLREPLQQLPGAWDFCCEADVTLVMEQLREYVSRHNLAPCPYILLQQCMSIQARD